MNTKRLTITLICSLIISLLSAQNDFNGVISFDKTVHDFGDIKLSDGHVQCEFTYKNIGSKPLVIHNVIASCGCTDPKWERKPLLPGESSKLKVIFKNDQGPYPFSKGITLYVSDVNKPIILRIKGIVHKTQKSLKQLYPINIGGLGLREAVFDMDKIDQGASKSESMKIANLSSKPMTLSFANASKGLSLKVSSNPIPTGSKAEIVCTINTAANQVKNWGNTSYSADIVVNGVKQKGKVQVKTMIKEGFQNISEDQRRRGALPQFKKSSIQLPDSKAGKKHSCVFTFKNEGKDDFIIYKAQTEDKGLTFKYDKNTAYQGSGTVTVDIDTSYKKGESIYIVTLITNSPLRPIISLFITVNIQ